MPEELKITVPGVLAEHEGGVLRVWIQRDPRLSVLVEERVRVKAMDGSVLGTVHTLDEAAVNAVPGLTANLKSLMRGVVEALKLLPEPPPDVAPEAWEYGEMRSEWAGGSGLEDGKPGKLEPIPIDALTEAGSKGWEVVDVRRNGEGEILRVLMKRRIR